MNNISGHRIRVARNMHIPRLTQDDLVARMHTRHQLILSKNGISRIENGERYVTDVDLLAFAEVLKVSTAWLLGETSDPAPRKSGRP